MSSGGGSRLEKAYGTTLRAPCGWVFREPGGGQGLGREGGRPGRVPE